MVKVNGNWMRHQCFYKDAFILRKEKKEDEEENKYSNKHSICSQKIVQQNCRAEQCLTSYWVIRPLGSTGSSHFRKIMSSSGVKVSDSGAMPPGTGIELAEQTFVGEK